MGWLASWWKRWARRRPSSSVAEAAATTAQTAAAATLAPAVVAPAPALTPGTPGPDTLQDASTSQWAGTEALVAAGATLLRRPLLQRDGRVAGFEGNVPPSSELAQVITSHLISAGTRLTLLPWRFDRLPAVAPHQARCDGLMLVLPDAPFHDAAAQTLMSGWRAMGMKIGCVDRPRTGADFVRLNAKDQDLSQIRQQIQACRQVAPATQIVVTDLRNLDDLEQVLLAGATWACGFFDRVEKADSDNPLPPQVGVLSRLIQMLMREATVQEMGDALRSDVSLTYRMIRHLNSPLLGMTRQVESVDQALMILGRQLLYRWLTSMMLVAAQGRASSLALQEIALARAQFMETLAARRDWPAPALFTTGLLSLLDVMLQQPMDKVLETMGLPDNAVLALKDRSGPWVPLLHLARALEAGDSELAETLAADFGGLEVVNQAMNEAYRWAEEAAKSLQSD